MKMGSNKKNTPTKNKSKQYKNITENQEFFFSLLLTSKNTFKASSSETSFFCKTCGFLRIIFFLTFSITSLKLNFLFSSAYFEASIILNKTSPSSFIKFPEFNLKESSCISSINSSASSLKYFLNNCKSIFLQGKPFSVNSLLIKKSSFSTSCKEKDSLTKFTPLSF